MQPSPERRAPRRWARRLTLLLLGSAGAFAACEIGFRVVESSRLAHAGELWAVLDDELGWRNNPRFGDHNEDGLRDRPVPAKGRRLRVLLLGDSVLYYGDGVEDTVAGHLRARIASGSDPAIEILNGGVKGYTNRQELDFLEERGVALQPDLVGVAFVLNDCYQRLHQFRVEEGKIVGQDYDLSEEAVGAQPGWYRALRHSRFLVWLRHRLAKVDLVSSEEYTFDKRPDFKNAWRDEPWNAIEAQMRAMAELGRAKGFRMFVACVPFGDQYRADYLARGRAYVLKPQRKLRDICAELSIPFLDLYPALDRARDLEADGIHLTRAGRERAAAAIAAFLRERHLLESR